MRSTDFIRNILDIIDGLENQQDTEQVDYEEENPACACSDNETTQFANSPDENYTDEKVIFSIGNDINKPKHPSDLRADSFSMYPNMQYNPRSK
jgi:hypothetical protein